MTPQEARQILLLYRPGTDDWQQPDVAAAIELARKDPELGRWFQEHQAFQSAMRVRFREIEVPADLKTMVKLAAAGIASAGLGNAQASSEPWPGVQAARQSPTILRPPAAWWRTPAWLAAAAVLVLLLGLSALWLRPPAPDRFVHFEQMMVATALRGYNMDCRTNDMQQLRRYLSTRGAPADYHVTPALDRLQLLGGAALTWRSHPVAMVCFNRPDKKKVWLFVMDRAALPDPPSAAPSQTPISKLMTASWTEGDKIYVVAGPPEQGFTSKYL